MLYTLPELEKGIQTLFQDMSRPLVLDVGCYFGDTVVELAAHNPEINVLGLDIKYKRVVKSCRKIKRNQITNAKIAICDIQELLPVFSPETLDGVCVFFPDPFRKARHVKYRVLNDTFFQEMSQLLKPGGFIWLKTDHPEYNTEATETAKQFSFHISDCLPEGIIKPKQYKTLFEEIFKQQGLEIHQSFFAKK